MHAKGSQISQIRPADANNATAYTATIATEVTSIKVCNTSGSSSSFRLFHDDDGTTFDETSALYWDEAVPANATIEIFSDIPSGGIAIAIGGSLGVRSADANALTFTMYGVTADLAIKGSL